MAWRRGETNFLESALTRAVLFSALMTATAFGSLWLSAHPGTSSMGKLLALSLLFVGASSRMSATYQQGLLTLQRKRTGGNQQVTVKHIHQQVNVTEGGQAVVAGDKVTSRTRGRQRSGGRGMVQK
jgi:hypothetical protein